MIGRMSMAFFSLMLSAACMAQMLPGYARYIRLDQSEPKVNLLGRAALGKDGLTLNGKNAYATIPDSGDIHLGTKGLTLTAVIRPRDSRKDGAFPESLDMYLSKGREFIFGRNGGNLYVNFYDGRNWVATTIGGEMPEPGQWSHVAAAIEYFYDPAQADVGYMVTIYVNGEQVTRKRFQNVNPKPTDDLIEIGRGFGGGPWHYHGDIAEVAVYQRALTEGEINQMARSSSRVRIVKKGFAELKKSLDGKLEALEAGASWQGQWLLQGIRRLGTTGYDQDRLEKLVANLKSVVENSSWKEFTKKFNAVSPELKIFDTGRLAVLAVLGEGRGAFPLAAVLDQKDRREIFGEKTISWNIHYVEKGQEKIISDNHPGIRWKTALLKKEGGSFDLKIDWRAEKPLKFQAESVLSFRNARMESDFRIIHQAGDAVIREIAYPVYNLAALAKGGDTMLYPWMCGSLVRNPLHEEFAFGQEGVFPSGRIPVQFGAYYDEAKGIYFGFEDPRGRTKKYRVFSKRGCLNVLWTSPVPLQKNGDNSFAAAGPAVLELYQGQWFEAGRIYRRFLEKKADWWIQDLPRKDTPRWFRDNTLWILAFCGDQEAADRMYRECAYLREYFELPFGVHWYMWESEKIGWPHFQPKPFFAEANRKIQKLGVYTMPYVDNRLWAVKDGPGKTDYMYSSHGAKFAARNAKGGIYEEKYTDVNAIMCPAVREWQQWMGNIVDRLGKIGVDAIYHDQVATAAPKMCFSRKHGHPLNDGATWVENGYAPMFDMIRGDLRKKYPRLCHTTEENADPYLKMMDGYMVWRWTQDGQVPLFQSLYSGRVQFVGRIFNHWHKGEPQSFYSKCAQQLVNAEQLGWFHFPEIRKAPEKLLYLKKLMHVRQVLLPYFNEGDMMAPLAFREPMPTEKCLWGGVVPQKLRMPKIANNSFARKDGSAAYVFLNTVPEQVRVVPILPEQQGEVWICRENGGRPVAWKTGQAVELAGRKAEIWIRGGYGEAVRVQKTMKRIASFQKGRNL